MKYIDRSETNLSVAGGYLWQHGKCLGKVVSVNAEYYTIIGN